MPAFKKKLILPFLAVLALAAAVGVFRRPAPQQRLKKTAAVQPVGQPAAEETRVEPPPAEPAADFQTLENAQPAVSEMMEQLRNRLLADSLRICSIPLPDALDETVHIELDDGQTLVLLKKSVRSENFRVVKQETDGTFTELDPGPVRTYVGTVEEHPDATVFASLLPDGLQALVAAPHREALLIAPLTPAEAEVLGAERGADGQLHAVYTRPQSAEKFQCLEHAEDGVEIAALNADGSMTPVAAGAAEPLIAAAVVNPVTVMQAEIGFDVGYTFFANRCASDVPTAVATMESFVNNTLNPTYINATMIEHLVGTIVVRTTSATCPYYTLPSGYDTLPKLREIWNGQNSTYPSPSSTHDLAHCAVSQSQGVTGLAYVGVIGTANRYSMGTAVSGMGYWTSGSRHEVGHNWSLSHGDGAGELTPWRDGLGLMTGGFHDRINSVEAGKIISHRNAQAGYLVDIGAYTAVNIGPYCPQDLISLPAGGAPIYLDVLANDYDANNEEIMVIDRIRTTYAGGEISQLPPVAVATELGGSVIRSIGTGPGGRDQLLYTPPATATVGAEDIFHYFTKDIPTTGWGAKSGWGCVRVTMAADPNPDPFGVIDTTGFLADSILDWDPATQISANWSYGYASVPGGTISPLTTPATADAWIGGDAAVLQNGAAAPRIGQYAAVPSSASAVVRRWTSDYAGPVTIEYDARRIQTGGDGCLTAIYHNGSPLWSQDMAATNPPPHGAGSLEVVLAAGDTLDFTVDAKTTDVGDWTFFHARILERAAADVNDPALLFRYTMDETILLPEGGGGTLDRRQAMVDRSGNNHHAALAHAVSDYVWSAGNRANAFQVRDGSQTHAKVEPDNLGNGATELTMSAWIRPYSQGSWKGILYARGAGNQLFSFASSGYTGNAIETRFLNVRVDTPSNSIPDNVWTHVAAVWKSGQRFEVYLNGQLAANGPVAPVGAVDVPSWYVGTADATRADRSFDGKLDDVALWSRALSAGEIQQIYQDQHVGVIGRDGASDSVYDDGWTAGDNGGSGFQAWEMSLGSGTASLGDSTGLDPNVDLNSSGRSFRLACASGYAHAWRDFSAPLQEGRTFSFRFAAGVAANNKGVDLRAFGSNVNGSIVNIASRAGTLGGTWYVNTAQGRQYFSDGPHPNTWFEVEVTQTRTVAGREQGIYKVVRHGAFSETLEGVYYGHIGNVKVYGSTGGLTDADAIYVNDFMISEYSGPPYVLPPIPVAEDYANDAAYADGWVNGDDGGHGFQPWYITTAGTGTSTIEDSTTLAVGNSGADINTNGVSFKLYHPDGGYIQCLRGFDEPLAVGRTFSLSVAVNQSALNMNKGLNINESGAGVNSPFLFGFRLAGGTYYIDGGPTFSDPPGANTRFDLSFTQVSETNYSWNVVRSGDYQQTFSGTGAGRIGGFKFYGRMGGDDPADAIFFNNLKITDAPAAGNPMLRITGFTLNGLDATLSFSSEAGAMYDIQGAADLTSASWSNLVSGVVGTGPDNTNTVYAGDVRFFRVRKVGN